MSSDDARHTGSSGASGEVLVDSSTRLAGSPPRSSGDSAPGVSGDSIVDPMIGQVVDGRYEIISRIGEGGMGEVYAAQHTRIHKRVALKLLRTEIVTNEEAVQRFEQEALSASSIGHKNIVGIEDSGVLKDGRVYLCMELLEGAPLNDMIADGRSLEPDRALNILIQTGHGLAAAHAKGIVHRDMKPENIFVTRGDEGDIPKLLDFGIAKVSQAEGNNHLTKTGTIFGTPFYMAPEQALGQAVDHRADIYAMGVIMYEIFCGAVPFQGESFMGILTQHITAEPMPPSQMAAQYGRTLTPEIENIIVRAMKKEPDDRYATMDGFVNDLIASYRGVAGAGMSSFMEPHRIPGPTTAGLSAMQSAAFAPAPNTGQAPAHAQGQPTPSPYVQSGQQRGPQVTPFPSDAFMPAQRKGRGALIAFLVIVLLAGGGAGLYFGVLAGGDDAGGKTAAAGTPPDASALTTTHNDPKTDASTLAPQAKLDAGSNASHTPDGTPATSPAARLDEPVAIAISTIPSGASFSYDGKKLRSPDFIEIHSGKPVKLTLSKSGYKPADITLISLVSADSHSLLVQQKGARDKPVAVSDHRAKVEIKLTKKRRVVRPPKSKKPDGIPLDPGDKDGLGLDPEDLQ